MASPAAIAAPYCTDAADGEYGKRSGTTKGAYRATESEQSRTDRHESAISRNLFGLVISKCLCARHPVVVVYEPVGGHCANKASTACRLGGSHHREYALRRL